MIFNFWFDSVDPAIPVTHIFLCEIREAIRPGVEAVKSIGSNFVV